MHFVIFITEIKNNITELGEFKNNNTGELKAHPTLIKTLTCHVSSVTTKYVAIKDTQSRGNKHND